ncbi:glycosyltransferase family 39 protein [Streptosporangium sp. NPDC004631]
MTLTARTLRSPAIPAILAFTIALWRIDVPSFWRDESVSVMAATMPLGELWELLHHIDAVHALYYLLLRPFAAFDGEFAARLPSALAVAAAAFGVAAIGRRSAAPRTGAEAGMEARPGAEAEAGLFAGLIYAVLPMVSRYGQEARSYALVSAVAVAATWVLLGERRSRYVGYGLLVALLGWFHLYALLLLPAHAVVVARGRGRGEIVPWSVSVAGAGLLLAPLAVVASGQRDEQLFWLKVPGLGDLAGFGVEMVGGGQPWRATLLPALLLALLVALVLLGAWYGRRSRTEPETGAGTPSPAAVAVPWLLLPVALSFLISQVYPVYNARYVMFVLPAVALLAGVGLVALRRAPLRWAVLAVLVALSATAHLAVREPAARPDDLRTLAAELSIRERPGDAVLYMPERFRLFVAVYGEPYDRLGPPGPGADRVWLVSRRVLGTEWLEDPRLRELKRDFRKTGQTRISGAVRITLYTRRLPSEA